MNIVFVSYVLLIESLDFDFKLCNHLFVFSLLICNFLHIVYYVTSICFNLLPKFLLILFKVDFKLHQFLIVRLQVIHFFRNDVIVDLQELECLKLMISNQVAPILRLFTIVELVGSSDEQIIENFHALTTSQIPTDLILGLNLTILHMFTNA